MVICTAKMRLICLIIAMMAKLHQTFFCVIIIVCSALRLS